MWYFAWMLGVALACALGILNALWFESVECRNAEDQESEEY